MYIHYYDLRGLNHTSRLDTTCVPLSTHIYFLVVKQFPQHRMSSLTKSYYIQMAIVPAGSAIVPAGSAIQSYISIGADRVRGESCIYKSCIAYDIRC